MGSAPFADLLDDARRSRRGAPHDRRRARHDLSQKSSSARHPSGWRAGLLIGARSRASVLCALVRAINFSSGPYFNARVKYARRLKYNRAVTSTERAVNAIQAVYRGALRARPVSGPHRDAIVTLDDAVEFLVRWLPVGWPRQVAEALHNEPRPDILVAPSMSPGARKAARDAGIGWVDESGAADIYYRDPKSGTVIAIETKGMPPVPLDTRLGWRPAALAVCEALLAGAAAPTVNSVVEATGISMGSAAEALKFLEKDRHLTSAAARGPASAREIVDRDALLDAYAAAAERLQSPISLRVGILWRHPVADAIDFGQIMARNNISWAATGALSARVLAPVQTEISPLEIYVPGRTPSDLGRVAYTAGLRAIDGGRLLLRPFPTPAGDKLTKVDVHGFRSMLWPRVYADLRTVGVRGEDAAQHLREVMTK